MAFVVANDSYSVDELEQEPTTSYILGLDSEPEQNDVYRRYLKNLNYTSTKNISIIVHNFAKMLFSVNSTTNLSRNASQDASEEEYFRPLNTQFDVANSRFILVSLTVIYVIIFITGVLGNVVTCIVIAKNKGMHTAVNYYLFSLAVSDLLLLVSGEP